MEKVIETINKFNQDRNWGSYHTPENIAKSISIEAAELLECFQWRQPKNLKAVEEELADVLIYSVIMAQRLDLDLETIMLDKIEKNGQKYPVNKDER